MPALIADAGEQASWPYVEFFTAAIRNVDTRRAYACACRRFFARSEEHGVTFATVSLVAAIPEVSELDIGHFLIGHAIFDRFDAVVKRTKSLIAAARQRVRAFQEQRAGIGCR